MEQKSEKEMKQQQDIHTNEELEIDLMDLLRKVVSIRKKIYKAAGIGLIIGVIVAISIPKQYTVEVTLSPEMGSAKGSASRLMPTLYSWGATSSISWSMMGTSRLLSMMESISSCEILVSSSR